MTDKVKVGLLGSDSKKLLENQKLQNWMKEVTYQNSRLMNNKRKRDEISLGFGNFKKRKLHDVGNRQIFDTGFLSWTSTRAAG